MLHLTNEQIEDILQTGSGMEQHLVTCSKCRLRVSEQKALAARLRRTFQSIEPSPILYDQLCSRLLLENKRARDLTSTNRLPFRWLRRHPLAAVAIALVVIMLRMQGLLSPQRSTAQQLEDIHRHNLSDDSPLRPHTEPIHFASYFESNLGYSPRLPEHDEVRLRGCCVQHFQGNSVATYVAQTPTGPISVVVLNSRPIALPIDRTIQIMKQVFWHHKTASCNLVGTQIGDEYYYAIGEMEHDHLQYLLVNLQS